MTATAETALCGISIQPRDRSAPVLAKYNRTEVFVKAGAAITTGDRTNFFETNTPVLIDNPLPGRDYGVTINEYGLPIAEVLEGKPTAERYFGGFHFAPGGNATAREGGDNSPAINPYSIWDIGFRPSCPDPRGMALVELLGGRLLWVDIYLLDADHHEQGTSRAKAIIADGRDLPMKLDGESRPASRGANFVGYRIWPTHKLLRRDSVTRAKRKIRAYRAGGDHQRLEKFLAAWVGHAKWADSRNLLKSLNIHERSVHHAAHR
ncbi:hypothetical protein G6L13_03495 [Agrobacterium tumefaciens]|uniref:phage major tropism determinant n=1 Tax=Agrobacterium tumefaciens TaxID=358 RepID=UPI0015747DA0|nr:hypothetical protein [Agrobacterium tumefaciens]NTA79548.1 hypothetical protein [Agrobacterium tumefaciens]